MPETLQLCSSFGCPLDKYQLEFPLKQLNKHHYFILELKFGPLNSPEFPTKQF